MLVKNKVEKNKEISKTSKEKKKIEKKKIEKQSTEKKKVEKNNDKDDSVVDFISKCRQYLMDKVSGYITELQVKECMEIADSSRLTNPEEIFKEICKKENIKVLKQSSFDNLNDEAVGTLISYLDCCNWNKALSMSSSEKDRLKISKMIEKIKKTFLSEDKLTGIQSYFNDVSKHKLLTAEEERRLSHLAKKGDESAKDKLVLSNLRLVISIAKRYQNRGLPLIDLIQEGNIGLLKAVQKFNADRGNKFSTYAHWWIQQAITRALADKGSMIRVPVHLFEMRNKILRFCRSFASNNEGKNPTIKEISAGTGISQKKIIYVSGIQNVSVMLDSGSNLSAISDVLSENSSEDFFDDALNKTSYLIRDLVSSLPARECEVLKMRFGINDDILNTKPMTLDNIGKVLGVTRERVRQIQNRALSRLKQRVRKRIMEN